MKNFNYAARDKTGKVINGNLVAVDRNAVLTELKAQELVPVSVVAEANGRLVKAVSLQRLFSKRTLVMACVVLVLLGGVVAVKMVGGFSNNGQSSQNMAKQMKKKPNAEKVLKIKEKTPALSATVKPIQPNEKPKVDKEATNVLPVSRVRISRATTNTLAYIMAAKRGELDENGNIRRKFTTASEQLINMMVNTKLGNPPPPLPHLPVSESINDILIRDIVVYDNDSPETIQEKENVAIAKQAIKEYIAQGGTPESFLTYFHDEHTKAYNEWKEVQQQTTMLTREGKLEEARRYADEKNTDFTARGIRNVLIFQGKEQQ